MKLLTLFWIINNRLDLSMNINIKTIVNNKHLCPNCMNQLNENEILCLNERCDENGRLQGFIV